MLLQCDPVVPLPSRMPEPLALLVSHYRSVMSHSRSQPGERGPGSCLLPGVKSREGQWWWLPASGHQSSFPFSVQPTFPACNGISSSGRGGTGGRSAVTKFLILVQLSRNQSYWLLLFRKELWAEVIYLCVYVQTGHVCVCVLLLDQYHLEWVSLSREYFWSDTTNMYWLAQTKWWKMAMIMIENLPK